jgi:hypothetical protein
MSRLLTSPTRHNPHIHSTHVPDWVTTDLVEVDKPLTAGFLGFTQITANSSIHTKATSYTDIIATTSANATLMRVLLKNTFTSNTATSNLVDIALGASSSEVDIVQNLNAGALADYTGSTTRTRSRARGHRSSLQRQQHIPVCYGVSGPRRIYP